jgi:hypothetical protein
MPPRLLASRLCRSPGTRRTIRSGQLRSVASQRFGNSSRVVDSSTCLATSISPAQRAPMINSELLPPPVLRNEPIFHGAEAPPHHHVRVLEGRLRSHRLRDWGESFRRSLVVTCPARRPTIRQPGSPGFASKPRGSPRGLLAYADASVSLIIWVSLSVTSSAPRFSVICTSSLAAISGITGGALCIIHA